MIFDIVTYATDDPSVPEARRAVAHWFLDGKLQVATQVGPDETTCAARLEAFLTAEVQKLKPRPRGERGRFHGR